MLMDRVVGVSYEQMAGISHTCTYDCRFFVYTYDIYTNIYIYMYNYMYIMHCDCDKVSVEIDM